jgi:pimeloyl-ACP methyl ester carboxylesterase
MSTATQQQLELRIHGPQRAPTLVYLPGLHGDWTLIGSFRETIGDRVRFIEVAYPDTLTWSLEDHATAVETALREHGVNHAWLLGESFSSQVVWSLAARHQFQIEGVVLAGGFVRHPARWAANLCGWCASHIPLKVITTLLQGYAKLAPWRFRKDPQTASSIRLYIDRFTENKRKALVHRLCLVAQADPRAAVFRVEVPVFALTGFWDPIVPWILVRPWLKRNCSALREFKVLWHADHNVLGTGPNEAAELVLRWMGAKRQAQF